MKYERFSELEKICAERGVKAVLAEPWAKGAGGAIALAESVSELAETQPSRFQLLYPDKMSLTEKVGTIAREIYGADDVEILRTVYEI